ncbi:SpoIID/LytB domain-containing protein [Cyanobium sp. ATX 6F1]|uniref:SpoIID/LytB domain-containing protein n=1 Tax=unclassified Cyanobium TaxID=2627006 RepID=UPI0020CFB35E|nr:SpoIID/LytB domain-containing protein [Cyanobium sp. ATX 6F1]
MVLLRSRRHWLALGRRWRSGFSRQARLKTILLTAPVGFGALGIGFMAQGLVPSTPMVDAPLIDAMLQAPPPSPPRASPSTPVAGGDQPDPLRGVQSRKATAAAGGSGQLSLAEPEAGSPLDLEIRVALLNQPASLQLGAQGPWLLRDRSGQVLRQGGAGSGLEVSGWSDLPAELWFETPGGEPVSVQGRLYDGRLRVVRQGGSYTVVNHLSLERYIASVVGSEMPSSWNIEALRAQAVAARSYALAHMARPASAHWHLGNTTRWQAYRGLESVNQRTLRAAASTAGVILSYQGGIVESLYAANQQIVLEAHGHLGASMSQEGAQQLASQGLRYNAILGRYYQGASLARLRAGAG